MKSVLLSPHNDDETLFAAYTLLRHRPKVIICFNSVIQEARYGITGAKRTEETWAALEVLGIENPEQWRYPDNDPNLRYGETSLETRIESLVDEFDHCFAPALEEGGHDQHNEVALMARKAFATPFGTTGRLTPYMTYVRGQRRSRSDEEVPFEPHWPALKLRAMACYESQITLENTRPWFDDWQREWYG